MPRCLCRTAVHAYLHRMVKHAVWLPHCMLLVWEGRKGRARLTFAFLIMAWHPTTQRALPFRVRQKARNDQVSMTRYLFSTSTGTIWLQAERKKRESEAELQAYQHDWQQHVLRLKEYFESQGLQNVDPSGGSRPRQPCYVSFAASKRRFSSRLEFKMTWHSHGWQSMDPHSRWIIVSFPLRPAHVKHQLHQRSSVTTTGTVWCSNHPG